MPRSRRIGLQHGRGMTPRRQAATPGVQQGGGGGKSQGPAHGQGVGIGLYLLTTGVVPGRSAAQGPVASYANTVLADLPDAYWRLGEASGTVAGDTSGHSVTGTYVNGPTLGQVGIPGAGGNTAIKCLGSVQSAQFGDVLQLAGTAFTIEFWGKFISAMGNFSPYVTRGDTTWRIARDGSSDNNFQFASGAGATTATNTSFTDGSWHHIVGVYDRVHLLLYYDGAVAASTAWTTDLPASSGKNVGVGFNSDSTLRTIHAFMDEVAVYSHALTPARVLAHYNAGITP